MDTHQDSASRIVRERGGMSCAHLICPDHREPLSEILTELPLVLQIYLGRPLIDHALIGLAKMGYRQVVVHASDRPAEVREYLLHAAAWGLDLTFQSCAKEKSEEQVRQEYVLPDASDIFVLDSLPQAPEVPILRDSAAWHESRVVLLEQLAPGQVGVVEHAPGVWRGLKAKIPASAVIEPPVWIGHHVIIRDDAKLGPCAFVENHAMIDRYAEVNQSTVAVRTYVGQMTNVSKSFVHGGILVKWVTGSLVRVVDHFLLSRLDAKRQAASGLGGRSVAAMLLILTSPVIVLALVASLLRGRPWVREKEAFRAMAPGEEARVVRYSEFPGLPGVWKKWPRLWRVVLGDFGWVGNPPLEEKQAMELSEEFERLWLHVPPAIFTAPEAEGSREPWDDEARLHAAMYASQQTMAWRRRILWRGMLSLLFLNKTT